MKTKVAAIYGKQDIRIREFELPEITDNELLVSVISDSVCLSTRKLLHWGAIINAYRMTSKIIRLLPAMNVQVSLLRSGKPD